MSSPSTDTIPKNRAAWPARFASAEPLVSIRPNHAPLRAEAQAIWEFRELLYFFVWRDVKTRYKQTALGVAWALLQPLLTTAIFTVVFAFFVKMPSEGAPYTLFAFSGLIPWTFFSQALTRSSGSLVTNANLISKVYFPRLLLPLAAAITPLVDLALTFFVLAVLLAWYQVMPTAAVLLLPAFTLLAILAAFAVGLCLSALNVKYRDVAHVVPFLVQIWMYASPVAYPVTVVPEVWRGLYSINPMVAVVEGFRWALLGTTPPDGTILVPGIAFTTVTLVSGFWYFKVTERTFADVI